MTASELSQRPDPRVHRIKKYINQYIMTYTKNYN
jgi:hypothetical protein